MASRNERLEVHFVGSSPLNSTADFISNVIQSIPKSIQRLPDGETGARANFIGWQHPALPITIIQPRWGGQPSAESAARTYTRTFRSLKDAGTIPADVRFQVCLPTPLSVVRGFVEDDGVCARIEPLYETRLLEALQKIQEQIPLSELTIQWDLPTEIAVLEYQRGRITDRYWKPYFEDVMKSVLQRIVKLAKSVKPEVEMGFHICYGDLGHVHFVQPEDMTLMVELANSISAALEPVHKIAYFHMPVPKERDDASYFEPLKLFRHGLESKIMLGVVHASDGPGSMKRLEVARAAYPNIAGISTECGLGRTSLADVEDILKSMSVLTAAN